MKFEAIKPGQTLFECRKARMRTASGYETWTVDIVSVDVKERTAVVHWNGNRDTQVFGEKKLAKLRAARPLPRKKV